MSPIFAKRVVRSLFKAFALPGLTKEGAENDGLKWGGEQQPHAVTSEAPYNLRVLALKALKPSKKFSLVVLQN